MQILKYYICCSLSKWASHGKKLGGSQIVGNDRTSKIILVTGLK